MVGAIDASADGATGDAQMGVAHCDQPPLDAPPGSPVVDGQTAGSGACASRTLGEVIQAVYALQPDLVDITAIHDATKPTLDGSFIYAFRKDDGGFALVFKRGGGDCPAGCTLNEYRYFETDDGCKVVRVGDLDLTQNSAFRPIRKRSGVCRRCRLWRTRRQRCARGLERNVRRSRLRHSRSLFTGCQERRNPFHATAANRDPSGSAEPGDGHGYVRNPSLPELNATPIPATFKRRSFSATLSMSNLPSNCIDERDTSLVYDFENYGQSQLTVHLVQTPSCPDSVEYCKGYVNAKQVAP